MTAPGSDPERASLAQSATPAATLAEIATTRPDLLTAIAAHPNCYPGLREWIDQVSGAVVAEPAAVALEPQVHHEPETGPWPEVVPEPDMSGSPGAARATGRLPWIALGVLVGLVLGGLGSAFLVLLVLPGLFGSVL